MKNWIFGLALLLICGCGNGSSSSKVPTIAIVNEVPDTVNGGKVWSQADLTAYIPIMQAQIHQMSLYWGSKYDAKVIQRTPQDGDIPLYFKAGSDPNCGPACHFVNDNGNPIAEVFVAAGLSSGNNPLLEAQHEALEVVVDPNQDGTEIVDPVVCFTYCFKSTIVPGMLECGENGTIDKGDIVPDFILPSWNSGPPPYDIMNLIKTPKGHC